MFDASGNIDPNVVIMLGGGLAMVLVLLLAGILVAVAMRPRARLKHRMVTLGIAGGGGAVQSARSASGSNRQRRVQERLKEIESRGRKRASRGDLRLQLLQAGVDMKPRSFMFVAAGLGLVVALGYLAAGYPALGAAPVGIFAAIMLPRWFLRNKAGRRQKEFTKHFANALDILVRGIKSGLPVGECLAIIGRESPDPVGEEFRLMVEGQRIGLTMDELLRRGIERIPTPEYKFFAIVLQIQQRTGGNLAETLENLSRVLRERKKLRDKIKALSAEAKASAMIIGSLPFFVAAAVQVITPTYLLPMFTEPGGQKMLIGAVLWMGFGCIVMAKMINFDI